MEPASPAQLADTAAVNEPGPPPTTPGPVPGAAAYGVPDAAAIQRALAECMTLADIDDAMAWRPGTARRRRWHDRDAGGLPPADAELGGMPLWFRSTFSRWRAETVPGARRTRSVPAEPPEALPDAPGEAPPEEAGPVAEVPRGDEEQEQDHLPDGEPAPGEPGLEPEIAEADRDLPVGVVGADEVAGAREVRSGFELQTGQLVLAHLRGGWRRAVVRASGRRTVLVDYQLEGDRLGPRRQRVGIDRIRVPGRF
ncbi:hypothetical protein GCM10009609_20360 [Pseudonocardia aurantiaca]